MDRYSRNTLIEQIGTEGQKKLTCAKVLVCGCGGLGSTVIANLASLGIGKIGLIDCDKLEITNYNRQYIHKISNLGKNKVESAKEWIEEYNSDVEVEIFPTELGMDNYEEIVAEYDILVDCFDSFKSKFSLNEIAIKSGKILVHGSATEFYGQVTVVIPNETPCLHCLIPEPDIESEIKTGVISPTVSLIASVQSSEVLKLILNIGTPLTNEMLTYNGLKNEFKKLKTSINSQCPLCKQ